MELYSTLKQIFQKEPQSISVLPKGLTNKNYLVEVDQQWYVVRIPSDISSQFVDRAQEKWVQIQLDALHFGIECTYFDEHTGIKITPFMPDLVEIGECINDETMRQVALKLKQLHQSHLQAPSNFDAIKKLHTFARNIPKEKKHDLESTCIQLVQTLHYKPCLCHNDLVSGNVLFDKNALYIIDYEYAANNDPLFDVISFLSENEIYDPALRNAFYETYFEVFTEQTQEHLLIWEMFQSLLWYYWALMMQKENEDPIYEHIASLKKHELERCHTIWANKQGSHK
ncbi:MAG: phosphotransferase [Erysipelotrichaceae bacterium]